MPYLLILITVTGYLILEKILHRKRLNAIPIRVHVNGTRGKTSVTRLIARMLREKGVRTVAKTTGDAALFIGPDGREQSWKRRGPARIQEQVTFIRRAAALKAEAIVVECMALAPPLQFTSEADMIQSTIGVITNVRPDHFEVMGKTLDDIAASLSAGIPGNGILVTSENRYLSFFKSRAARLNTRVCLTDKYDADFEKGFTGNTGARENELTARKVCRLVEGMYSKTAQFSLHEKGCEDNPVYVKKERKSGHIHFIDAFSANDIESAKQILDRISFDEKYPRPLVAVLNNRSDRPLRMLSFASFVARETAFKHIVLVGDHQRLARRHIYKNMGGRSVDAAKERPVHLFGKGSPGKVLKTLERQVNAKEWTLVGLGNRKGTGADLSRYFQLEENP